MKPQNAKGELVQHGLQHRQQVPLADGLHAAHYFPLGHGVDGIEMIQPRLAIVLTLMYRIHAQVAGLPLGVGFAPLGNGHLTALGVLHAHPVP